MVWQKATDITAEVDSAHRNDHSSLDPADKLYNVFSVGGNSKESSANRQTVGEASDRYFVVDSPIGRLYVGVGPDGIRLVRRDHSSQDFVRHYRERFQRLPVEAETCNLAEKVEATLFGEQAEVVLDLSETTPFRRRVFEVVSSIPRGEVRPYVWVACEVGSRGASRAVGTALANNPVPLLVPCHRVVRNDGHTGNYAFGAGEKLNLLQLEGVAPGKISNALYTATPAGKTVCYATCPNAKRIPPENRRSFRVGCDAVAAGYTPCHICRPVVA